MFSRVKRLTKPDSARFPNEEEVKDTVIFDPIDNQQSLFRQLSFVDTFGGTHTGLPSVAR
jgi:hypothetical protein